MTSSCTSSSSSNFFPARCFFRWRNKWKSLGVRSGLYGRWSNISHLNFSRSTVVMCVEWGHALLWSRHMPRDNIPLLLFWMAHRSRVKVSQYAAALIVAPGHIKSTKRTPFLSQNMDAMIFFTEIEVLNFLVLQECVWHHCCDCCLDSGVWWKAHVSSPVTTESRNSSTSCAHHARKFSAEPIHLVFWSSVNIFGT